MWSPARNALGMRTYSIFLSEGANPVSDWPIAQRYKPVLVWPRVEKLQRILVSSLCVLIKLSAHPLFLLADFRSQRWTEILWFENLTNFNFRPAIEWRSLQPFNRLFFRIHFPQPKNRRLVPSFPEMVHPSRSDLFPRTLRAHPWNSNAVLPQREERRPS